MINENTTLENVKRFTVGKVTCSVKPSRYDDNFDELVLSHEDYSFTCLISHHSFATYKNDTSRIFLCDSEKQAILTANGLEYTQGYTIRDKVKSMRDYGATKEIETPRYINMRTAKGARFEKFCSEWFSFIDRTEFQPFKQFAEEMSNRVDEVAHKAEELIQKTKNSEIIKDERETVVRNKFARMKMVDSYKGMSIDVSTFNMTDEQKEKLFIFLDEMSK